MMNGAMTEKKVNFVSDDLFINSPQCSFISAHKNNEGRLNVTLSVGEDNSEQVFEFPTRWLRHNCMCDKCFNPNSQSHIYLFGTLASETHDIQSVEIKDGLCHVTWSSGHVTSLDARWLYVRRFTEDGQAERKITIYTDHQRQPWGDKFNVQSFDFTQVETTDDGFMRFADAMIKYGICLVTGCPDGLCNEQFVTSMGGNLTSTHYGKIFHVVSLPQPDNLAYTCNKIELHVDQPFLDPAPQIQILHCIKPAEEGGENIFADSYKAAHTLKVKYPEHYRTLTTQPIEFEDIVSLTDMVPQYAARACPIIVTDAEGNLDFHSNRFNNQVKSSYFNGSIEESEKWYDAMEAFFKLLYENPAKLKTQAGELVIFDNCRVMHAREGFRITEPRRLEGAYMSWDTIYSRLRVMKIKQAQKSK